MIGIKDFFYRFKIKKENRQHFQEVLKIERKIRNKFEYRYDNENFDLSMIYIGLAYEYFVINAFEYGFKCIDRVNMKHLLGLLDLMNDNESHLVVGFIVYDNIKDNLEYKKNYYFKIFEVGLLDCKFPKNENLYVLPFLKAWENTRKIREYVS